MCISINTCVSVRCVLVKCKNCLHVFIVAGIFGWKNEKTHQTNSWAHFMILVWLLIPKRLELVPLVSTRLICQTVLTLFDVLFNFHCVFWPCTWLTQFSTIFYSEKIHHSNEKKTRIKTTAEGKKSISESDLTIFGGQSFDVSCNSFTSTHIYHIARASSSRTPMLQFQ